MPAAEDTVKSSWADEVEEVEGGNLPPPVEKNDGTSKTITEYSMNDEGKKVKIISYYRIEKHRVARTIAERKTWRKYGLSKNDKPGPNPATTITAEDVFMHFLSNKDEEQNEQEEIKKKLLDQQKGQVKCRLCKEDHWTKQCPYKDKLEPLRSSLLGEEAAEEETPAQATPAEKPKIGGVTQGKYIPPSMRDGGSKKGESMMSSRGRDETATVRVTNLSENTREQDLQDLFRPFGDISRIFLAKDKNTGQSKGFAFINFKRREDAAKAIQVLNGYGYDHLILSVEWAKPSGTQ
ncbi:eukaryotic translation initiation factor 3 subunit G isoform X1 [Penaeus vannamei]|uniref:Eukaryotic translation initiation factor 3 subunit G n=2 Tax=Penaeus vannamei TaxID=6689 RepID=A0A3R7QN85_PENVA|nr:eukaryotic translation initiation factor 3 subunit G-like [Penaeus vannamei]ROT84476.1 eukaryotic translation initiation factor 3 subunit G [Penaeus vannamei]